MANDKRPDDRRKIFEFHFQFPEFENKENLEKIDKSDMKYCFVGAKPDGGYVAFVSLYEKRLPLQTKKALRIEKVPNVLVTNVDPKKISNEIEHIKKISNRYVFEHIKKVPRSVGFQPNNTYGRLTAGKKRKTKPKSQAKPKSRKRPRSDEDNDDDLLEEDNDNMEELEEPPTKKSHWQVIGPPLHVPRINVKQTLEYRVNALEAKHNQLEQDFKNTVFPENDDDNHNHNDHNQKKPDHQCGFESFVFQDDDVFESELDKLAKYIPGMMTDNDGICHGEIKFWPLVQCVLAQSNRIDALTRQLNKMKEKVGRNKALIDEVVEENIPEIFKHIGVSNDIDEQQDKNEHQDENQEHQDEDEQQDKNKQQNEDEQEDKNEHQDENPEYQDENQKQNENEQ